MINYPSQYFLPRCIIPRTCYKVYEYCWDSVFEDGLFWLLWSRQEGDIHCCSLWHTWVLLTRLRSKYNVRCRRNLPPMTICILLFALNWDHVLVAPRRVWNIVWSKTFCTLSKSTYPISCDGLNVPKGLYSSGYLLM